MKMVRSEVNGVGLEPPDLRVIASAWVDEVWRVRSMASGFIKIKC